MLWCYMMGVKVPEDSVGGVSLVSDVIEEHLKLLVIIKVCSDNSTNG